MAPATHSVQEEANFMELLLSGIDASIFESHPSPDRSPKKRKSSANQVESNSLIDITASRGNGTQGIAHEEDISALLEGAENWDWDDMLSPVRKKPKREVSVKEPVSSGNTLFRCEVEDVEDCGGKKKIHVSCRPDRLRKVIFLEDEWIETNVQKGDIVNVIGSFPPSVDSVRITSKENALILHPDILLTATSVSNAPHCARRPLLSLLLRASSDVTPSLVFGNIIHEVMQRCLSADTWDEKSIRKYVEELVQDNLHSFFRMKMDEEYAVGEICQRAQNLAQFSKKYVRMGKRANGKISGQDLAITKVLGVEEDILAPKYGLKGKVDASVLVEGFRSKRGNQNKTSPQKAVEMPFEIKTGRSIAGLEHRAQTMLYTILMAERYGSVFPSGGTDMPPSGLLYYTHSEEIIPVSAEWNEVRGLFMIRNELANFLSRRTNERRNKDDPGAFLPPTIDDERICGRCYANDSCMLYRKAVDRVEDTSSPISELYKVKTGHLSQDHIDFFKHWEHLLSLEEQESIRFRKELWTLGAQERAKLGRCIADVVLDPLFMPESTHRALEDRNFRRHVHRFIRHKPHLKEEESNQQSMLNGHINVGDAVSISVSGDDRLLALSRGFILELNPDSVIVGADIALSNDMVKERSPFGLEGDVVFRIDKDEMASGMARVRDNLAQLFYVTGPRRLMQNVVELRKPEFETVPSLQNNFEALNEAQTRALQLCLGANDYALILGMPGTGKTTTIASLIMELVARRKTVLLTSYTHSAVDTILLKLKRKLKSSILRLGGAEKVHPEVRKFTLGAGEQPKTVKQLEEQLLRPSVVACTALSIDHALFSRRHFDYCIVDEASQITLPTCLGPLRFADKFVLVGDHYQLPALVKSKSARKGGLDVSLFRRLSDAHPHAVATLDKQYRMNADIMLLSNKLIYNDRLQCGSPDVATRSLKLTRKKASECSCMAAEQNCWLQSLLQENCRAVFVNTDDVPALDSRVGNLLQNTVEAELVTQLTETLLENGVREEQIGIISLYRQQIKLLSHQLRQHTGIEILTADRSQGRDKDCIIISLVRSNEENQIGDLISDWRRINVAFTRARSKLVIFGSRRTLNASPLLQEFFRLMDANKWVLNLPHGAEKPHSKGASLKPDPSESRLAMDETKPPSGAKKVKHATADAGIVRSRPILRDLMNDLK